MSQTLRRHRINKEELNPVRNAVRSHLIHLLETRGDQDEAEQLFRFLYRMHYYDGQPNQGAPRYPPFSWSTVRAFIQPERMVPLISARMVVT